MSETQRLEVNPEHLQVVEPFLRKGAKLHAFRSGGGLRVLRVEGLKETMFKTDPNHLFGYGEHPTVDEAFRILADDLKAGARPYKKVYNGKVEENYWTGTSDPAGPLDRWVLQGHTFDAKFVNGKSFEVKLRGLEQVHAPKEHVTKAQNGGGPTVWTNRGYTYRTYGSADGWVSTEVVKGPPDRPGHRAWMYYADKTGYGTTLHEAFVNALEAPPVEDPEAN